MKLRAINLQGPTLTALSVRTIEFKNGRIPTGDDALSITSEFQCVASHVGNFDPQLLHSADGTRSLVGHAPDTNVFLGAGAEHVRCATVMTRKYRLVFSLNTAEIIVCIEMGARQKPSISRRQTSHTWDDLRRLPSYKKKPHFEGI